MRLYRLLLFFCFLLPFAAAAQGDSLAKVKKQADDYFQKQHYEKALYFYNRYRKIKAPDSETLTKIAIASYHTNDLNSSTKILRDLESSEKNIEEDVYLYTAKILQSQARFSDAIKYYKKYLANAKSNTELRRPVRDEIRRCAVGKKLSLVKDLALVENLGENVNTKFDEYAPVQSPNYGQKIYFSSARSGSKGGLRNTQGFKDNEYGTYSSDMYFSVQEQGAWAIAEPMGGNLNSPKNERLIDFNLDGSVLYFFKGDKEDEGQIYVDTFSNNEEEVKFPSAYSTGMNSKKGDKTAYFYNDSLVIFSSYRKGGFGGYDLYAMVKQDDEWMTPFNLGPKINSAYDEISPFLSHNGRVLYFSSNDSRRSSGGYDVFSASYDDLVNEWKDVENLGLSINSSEDDTYFRLTKDGKRAYFTSWRKSGLGGADLYIAYFKADRPEQAEVSFPLTFIQLENIEERLAIANSAGGARKDQGVGSPTEEAVAEEKSIDIKYIYYDEDRDVLNADNKKKIAVATELMKRYPETKLLLYSHSDEEGTLPFNMYFSIKRAEKVAQDMVAQGIEGNRIVVMGLGPLYPVALNEINEAPNPMGRKLNRRIEFKFIDIGDEELNLSYEEPKVSKFQAVDKGDYFKKATKNLFYKIQIASTTQMFDDQILDIQPDPMVEKRIDRTKYHYTIGLYRTFSTAYQFQRELKKSGLGNSKIIPYINGYRVPKYKIEDYIENYPDLAKYLDFISEY